LSRRITIASTPAGGGSAVTTSYLWCNMRICQARNAANTTSREYLAEGEFVPGSPGQPYVYGIDQVGSVRRAFADATTAPAFSYEPYGNALQATPPATDLGYAGMFYNADSGLYLTQFRAYDPVAGRWLSRDPIGESSDPAGNLYPYVGGNPLSLTDPFGLDGIPGWGGTSQQLAQYATMQATVNSPTVQMARAQAAAIHWDSPYGPDYVTASVDIGLYSASVTYTRYGDIWTGEGYANMSFGGNISGGRMMCEGVPKRKALNDFLSGWSGSAGYYAGFGSSGAANRAGAAINVGMGFGGGGASAQYNTHRGNLPSMVAQ
jgi:RHS repeat-associated protein